MAWAECPTHGPIQDASEVLRGDQVEALRCRCGLDCEPYEPTPFVEHDELKVLAKKGKQPSEEVAVADAEESGE